MSSSSDEEYRSRLSSKMSRHRKDSPPSTYSSSSYSSSSPTHSCASGYISPERTLVPNPGHGFHHSRSHSQVKHEHRGHDDRDRRHHDHNRRDEFRKDSPPPSYSSPSPTHYCVCRYTSPERTLVPKPKRKGDVLESMENSFTNGPLEILKNCVHDGRKVMVWIRNHNGIRGICTGFVLAFDKFWNLLMQDVDEVYQKSRYPKTPFLQSVKESSHLPEASSLKKKKKTPGEQSNPKVVKDVEMSESARQEARERKKKRKKEEKKKRAQERAALCKRHVTKIFIRGDNVVLVGMC